MNKFILLLALVAISSAAFTDKEAFSEFLKFQEKYNKKYSSLKEYMARFEIFKRNLNKLSNTNAKSYTIGVTQFFDMTTQEFRKKYLNLNMDVVKTIKFKKVNAPKTNDAPEEWNWIEQKAVGPVKNQGSCGSCWAFSTVENVEGMFYMKYKEQVILSEQELVDCDTNDGGCDGGLMENAFTWLMDNGGLVSEEDYPYTATVGTCKYDKSKIVAKVDNYVLLDTDDEEAIKEYCYKTGPLAIALNADSLQWYWGGIIEADEYECDPQGLNHAVLLAGWGVEAGTPYWLVRNSWGKSWGEDGNFRIYRGKGTCGINTYVTSSEVSKP